MKADTFAKLVVLETVIDAEVGHLLEHRPAPMDSFREGLVARISDLVDEIDALDAVAAARTYDAIVDFLSQLPEDEEGIIDTALRFRRAVDRISERGMDPRELKQASTWAVVLDELLAELADEYHAAVKPSGEVREREYLRAQTLLARAREAADRMLWEAGDENEPELRSEMDRLTFAVRHQRLKPTTVDYLIRPPQRRARLYRPSTLTRIGAFVLGQVMRRNGERAARPGGDQPNSARSSERGG
ncbi:MAG TPA: hypothetical protein VFL93_17360 [Longimicrobiaceae bacterium]|nr:hypothetical protein [Longimicrobiaceae bacterium]